MGEGPAWQACSRAGTLIVEDLMPRCFGGQLARRNGASAIIHRMAPTDLNLAEQVSLFRQVLISEGQYLAAMGAAALNR